MLNIAVRAARAAADDIVHAMDRIDRVEVKRKGKTDWVTSIDHKAEENIRGIIHEAYPDHAILGEESGWIGPEDAEVVWIVDPLDGTLNFMHGVPHFAISIAIQIKGEVQHGLIYDPLQDELYTATKGKGAQLNQQRMRVSKEARLSHALLSATFPMREHEAMAAQMAMAAELFPQVAGVRRMGAAALDFAYLAAGRIEGGWASGLKIWDMAAGVLLVQEAGGIVLDHQGGHGYLESGQVVMGNPTMVAVLSHTLAKHAT